MNSAVPLAVDIAGVLSLASLAAFLTACVRLIQDRSDAARHATHCTSGISRGFHSDRRRQLSHLLIGFTSREG